MTQLHLDQLTTGKQFARRGNFPSVLRLEPTPPRVLLVLRVGSIRASVDRRDVPTADAIRDDLTAIANEWRLLAVFWHAYVATLWLAIATRRGLSNRFISALLVPPLLSVSGLAWHSNNPFNGALFAAVSVALGIVALRLPPAAIRIASGPSMVAGLICLTFGWVYPHFVATTNPIWYLIAAPLGLLPCPTLSAISGLTLMVEPRSTTWMLTLASISFVYAAIGVFGLAVTIDIVLFAGAAALVAARRRGPIGQR
jgi:hypothetical protein